jgi:hypothetical protein
LDALPDGFKQFGREPELGHILFEDFNGDDYAEGADGEVNQFDRKIISLNTAPRINYGVNASLSWKGFSVSALFQGVANYDKFFRTLNTNGGVFQIGDRPYFDLWTDAWSAENPDGAYPKIQGWGRPELGHAASTFWKRNGAYVRLKNLNVSYSIPVPVIQKVGLQSALLFVNATNLFVISDFKVYDPEQNSLDSFPLMKTVSGGINITF